MIDSTSLRRVVFDRLAHAYRASRTCVRAHALARRLEAAPDPSAWWDALQEVPEFRPLQKRTELLELLHVVRSLDARRICEIGTASGGTLCALARAAGREATIVTVDLTLVPGRRTALGRLARTGQRIVCLEGDAHQPDTRDRVREAFDGKAIDLLLIDGDHSADGVRRDFALYAPLVRNGGVVALHDIVPDFSTRYGRQTSADTGGVPQFWQMLRARYSHAREVVEDPEQDGYGLGLLERFACRDRS